jgi:plastocyanin
MEEVKMKRLQIVVLALLVIVIGETPRAHAGTIAGKVVLPGKVSHENVIVYVEGVSGEFKLPSKRPQMNHQNLQFVPNRLAVFKGATVDFPNSDPVFHSAFSISETNPFDLGIYGQGREKFVHFKNPGVTELFCHIHAHMHAFILVLENPFFTVTAKDGSFTIPDLPKGTYRVNAWWTPAANSIQEVTVSGNEPVSLNFTLIER